MKLFFIIQTILPYFVTQKISIHWRLKHQNIAQLLNIEVVDHHLVAIMELCARSNLQGLIQVVFKTGFELNNINNSSLIHVHFGKQMVFVICPPLVK